jgi:hypothetical protein
MKPFFEISKPDFHLYEVAHTHEFHREGA